MNFKIKIKEYLMNYKKAFTLIELIFVILIISILSIVFIPKLLVTRDDAKIAKEIENVKISLKNLGSEYIIKKAFLNYTSIDANKDVECFIFDTEDDGDVSLKMINTPSPKCTNYIFNTVKSLASKDVLTSNGAEKVYSFGGFTIRQ
jgi:general secretion pathway protein G